MRATVNRDTNRDRVVTASKDARGRVEGLNDTSWLGLLENHSYIKHNVQPPMSLPTPENTGTD